MYANCICMLFLVAVSCSSNSEADANVSNKPQADVLLSNFYGKPFNYGATVQTKQQNVPGASNRSVEVQNLQITEVFVDGDERARGYVISDKETSELLYFFDVDRVDYKMTAIKVDAAQTMTFNDINEIDKYISTNEFDFITIKDHPDFEPPTTEQPIALRPRYTYGSCFRGVDGNWVRGVYITRYFLGIRISKTIALMKEDGTGQVTVGCNEEYNPN